jgi:2-desacetyl-2-hydroxyethyl bacteriochlorophyllide A dehydrogenase
MSVNKMKALSLKKPSELELIQTKIPKLAHDEVLVKVKAVSICGTDIHAYNGTQGLFDYPRIIGHEIAGIISKMNFENNKFKVGDRVSIIPYIYCDDCIACNKGIYGSCENLKVAGVHIEGGLAEYIKMPIDNLLKIPKIIDYSIASLIEPLSISAHAVRKAKPKPNENILIIGMGPIGVGAAEIARLFGANIILADISESRRKIGAERFNYKNILDPFDDNYFKNLEKLTDGNMPDTIIDTTGSGKSMETSINYLSYGGKIVYVGIYDGDLKINDIEFHKRQTQLLGSRAALKSDFQFVINAIKNQSIDPKKFITDKISFDENVINNLKPLLEKGLSGFKSVIEFN